MDVRLAEVNAIAHQKKCTHILVSDAVDVAYISGFRASNSFALVSPGEYLLFTDFRYRSVAQRFCMSHKPWRFIESAENGFATIGNNIPQGSRIGIQSDSMTVDQFDCIRALWRGVTFCKLGHTIARISSVKTSGEIASMRRAARIGDKALAVFCRTVKPGTTEQEAAAILDDACRRMGSEGPSFPTIVLFGANAALPHGHPSNRKLKAGDWILCDFGCIKDNLCSDMTRTMVMGAATPLQRRIYDIVAGAQAAGRVAVRAGKCTADVDAAARGIIADAGYGEAFGHATGHGLGRRVHEKPRIGSSDKTILQENMVVTVEPGIYIRKFGGVRIEDMVLVTGQGCRCLTNFPRNLIELD
jgi:Xaa-Pro aminopeptidase